MKIPFPSDFISHLVAISQKISKWGFIYYDGKRVGGGGAGGP